MKRFLFVVLIPCLVPARLPAETVALENRALRLEVQSTEGSARLVDKVTGQGWDLPAPQITLKNKRTLAGRPSAPISRRGNAVTFKADAGTEFQFRLAPASVEYSFTPGADVDEVLLLDKALAVGPGDSNYYAVPSRLGILLPA